MVSGALRSWSLVALLAICLASTSAWSQIPPGWATLPYTANWVQSPVACTLAGTANCANTAWTSQANADDCRVSVDMSATGGDTKSSATQTLTCSRNFTLDQASPVCINVSLSGNILTMTRYDSAHYEAFAVIAKGGLGGAQVIRIDSTSTLAGAGALSTTVTGATAAGGLAVATGALQGCNPDPLPAGKYVIVLYMIGENVISDTSSVTSPYAHIGGNASISGIYKPPAADPMASKGTDAPVPDWAVALLGVALLAISKSVLGRKSRSAGA